MSLLKGMTLREAATRPDFIKLMDAGLKTAMMKSYNDTYSEYEDLVNQQTSTKAKETYPALSSIGLPELVLEGENYKESGIGAMQSVDVTNYKYGRIIAITREMVDDDQTKMISGQPQLLGAKHRQYENMVFFSQVVGGSTASTSYEGSSKAIFTTAHLSRIGGSAGSTNTNVYTNVTLSAGSLLVALSMINLWRGVDDEHIIVMPKFVVVSDRLWYTAKWLIDGPGSPSYGANGFGPASAWHTNQGASLLAGSGLSVKKCTWLTKMGGAALDWYIWTDVNGWIFQVREPLELYAEGDLASSYFERDVMRWKSRKRFGVRNIDWRTAMKIS